MRLLLWLVVFSAVSVSGSGARRHRARVRGDEGMRRKVRIALFFSKSLMDSWVSRKNVPASELTDYLQSTFLQEFNKLWSEPQLGAGIDIKFEITRIQYLTAHEEAELRRRQIQLKRTNGDYAGAAAFCDWSKDQMSAADQWNIPAYITDGIRQADFNARTPGRAFGMGRVCEKSCVVMEGKVADWRFEPLFANLLAHEVGHIFGFQHPPAGCRADIMWSPGRNDNWSVCTKRKALEIFSNPWVYPCLDYQFGIMPPPTVPPGRVSEGDLAVITQNCPKGEVGVHTDYSGQFFYANGYLDWFKKAPQWWHEENVCRWLPCRQEYKGKALFYALAPLTGFRCGENKICESETRCVSAGNSGCGKTSELGGLKGSFSSYKYNGRRRYLPNLKCAWRITVPRGLRVKLSFESMDVPGRFGCGTGPYGGDSVNVYNGDDSAAPLMAKLCNSRLKTVKSSSNVLYVTFTSDHNAKTAGSGFQAVYKAF